MKKQKSIGIIILVAVLLLIVSLLDTWSVFEMTSKETMKSGNYQLTSISGELESTINNAEKLTFELALKAREYLDDKDALRRFIFNEQTKIKSERYGAFNLYMAGRDWDIIPEFTEKGNFKATERDWYTGALNSHGNSYVTAPYIDAVTKNICYTVSVMLGDGDTVLGVDYTLDNIQVHIKSMYETGSRDAVIVTGEGIIAGCADETLLGSKLVIPLPEYSGIFSLAKKRDGLSTLRVREGFLYQNYFAAKSGNGWYLIIAESDWDLYKDSYIQLITTIALSFAIFIVIIILYSATAKSRKNAVAALNSKDEFLKSISKDFHAPLRMIHSESSPERVSGAREYTENFARINEASQKLSEIVEQIISYKNIEKSILEKEKPKKTKLKTGAMNRMFRLIIVGLLILVMVSSTYISTFSAIRLGNSTMSQSAASYTNKLSEWIGTQKSILDMFCSEISVNPVMLNDYDATIKYLDSITKQYPEISASYMTTPEREHTVYMNSGWEPDKDWHVEDRQWYKDTINSKTGWNISAPYYDEQTNLYCVTISERVYDSKTGKFLGNFGIDFYMDKLIDILDDSYSKTGYAFLVDGDGNIINHPSAGYQMTETTKKNISDMAYADIVTDGETMKVINNYDNSLSLVVATKNEESNFTIYVVNTLWSIYGRTIIFGSVGLVLFIICIILVYRLLTNMIRFQVKTNKQLQDSADAAIAAGKAKSEFLAHMSHEIRTPINAVLGMNEMILRESDDKDVLDYAANIQSAGKTLLSIINGILDFSKIEDGKMELMPVNYELTPTIDNIINSVSSRISAKKLEFVVNIDENLPSILFGDDVRLTQIIMNLLTNAVKYTESGQITFTMRENSRDDNSVLLYVEVRDTGIGIKEEDMEKLFESFERLDEIQNRNIEGTGLGMAIVTRLLNMMDSELHVESEYRKGSTFYFVVRQQIVERTPLGKYNYAEGSQVQATDTGKEKYLYVPKASILVVDDNTINLKVIRNLMKRNGIVPDLVTSGAEAIINIKEKKYDIVFLDHMMPGMDGMETLATLKKEGVLDNTDLSVIALTANAVSGAREKYLQAGFHDYLSKPVNVNEMENLLKKYLPHDIIGYKTNNEKNIEEHTEQASESATHTLDPDTRTNLLDYLKLRNINVEDGLSRNSNDVNAYAQALSNFVEQKEERVDELRNYYNSKEWGKYQICIHSLKSDSADIGASSVFENAQKLEKMSAKADAASYDTCHKQLLSALTDTVDIIKAGLVIAEWAR